MSKSNAKPAAPSGEGVCRDCGARVINVRSVSDNRFILIEPEEVSEGRALLIRGPSMSPMVMLFADAKSAAVRLDGIKQRKDLDAGVSHSLHHPHLCKGVLTKRRAVGAPRSRAEVDDEVLRRRDMLRFERLNKGEVCPVCMGRSYPCPACDDV